jgi:tetratricopeptide (TPR) repeat protein
MAPSWWRFRRRHEGAAPSEQRVRDVAVDGDLVQAGGDVVSHVTADVVAVGDSPHVDMRSDLTVHGDLNVSGGYVAGRDIHITQEATPAPRPRLLPRDTPDFVNRVTELTEAAGLARNAGPSPVIVFTGSAGAGKTTLAVRLCHSLAESHPDGALFADIGGFGGRPRPTSDVLAEFLLALGLPAERIPARFEDRRNQFRTMTADSRLVVLIDNVSEEAQVRDLLPAGAAVAVVVTSRRRLAGLSGARLLEVGGLRREAATELLRLVARQAADASDETLSLVASYCAGLPLALVIAGARMNVLPHSPGRRMAELLGDEKRRLDWLSAGDLAVRTSFQASYGQLPEDEQRAFRLLSRVGGGRFTTWHLAVLHGIGHDRAERILTHLHDLNLVRTATTSDGCDHVLYQFHDLIGDFAKELCALEGRPADPDDRLITAYRRITALVGRALSPTSGGVGPLTVDLTEAGPLSIRDHHAWCAVEYTNVLLMARRASDAGRWSDAAALGGALMPFFQTRCMWDTAEECYAIAVEAADRSGDTGTKATLLLAVAGVRRSQARWAEAVDALEECLTLQQGRPPGKEAAYALGGIGVALRNEGSWEAAWRCFEESRRMLSGTDDPWGTAFAVRGLGTVRQAQERWEEAMELLSEAVSRFRAAGDTGREAMALVRVGAVLRGQGRPREALAVLEPLTAAFESRHNRSWVGITAVHRAACWSDLGDQRQAEDLLDLAVPVFDELGDSRWQAIAHLHRSIVHRRAGHPGPARTCLEVAAAGFAGLGDRPGSAYAAHERGLLLLSAGDGAGARAALSAAHEAFRALGSRRADRIAALLEAGQPPAEPGQLP